MCCLDRLARKMTARAPSPQTVVSAPAAVAVGARSWQVTMQNGFVRFMFDDGNHDLTQYNFAVTATRARTRTTQTILLLPQQPHGEPAHA